MTFEDAAGCLAFALGAALYIAAIVAVVDRITGGRIR